MVRPECVKHKAKGGARQPIHLYFVIITDYPHITTALPFAGEKGEIMRPIDAESLKHIVNGSKYYGTQEQRDFCDMITEAPTIDAVPIVRCKDCKCWTEWSNGTGSCSRFALDWIGTDADDFCSMGERKDDE